MSDPTINLHTFTGTGAEPHHAVNQATGEAREYLRAHQWLASDGRSAYHVATSVSEHKGRYTCVISIIGPEKSD